MHIYPKVSTNIMTKLDEESKKDEDEEDSNELAHSPVEKKLDIIGAGTILSDMAILTGKDFFTNYIRCETDVQVCVICLAFSCCL